MGPNQRVDGYYSVIRKILSEIETFTDRSWDLPSCKDYVNNLTKGRFWEDSPVTSYMQYVRHFGFPSPLLDWTRSPFVAAYFAFRDLTSKASSVAVYKLYDTGEFQFPISATTYIYPIYSASRKNKRHYLQQSVYTICLKEMDDHLHYGNYENSSGIGEDDGLPITKHILPAIERLSVLQSLEAHNINAYSFMGTEERLLEALFLQAYKRSLIEKNISGPCWREVMEMIWNYNFI